MELEQKTTKFITSDKINYYPKELHYWLDGKTELITPITVELHPSNMCNNDCVYCFAKQQRDGAMLSHEDSMVILEKLGQMNVKGLILSGGGEPTMSPHFIDIIKEAKKQGMEVGVITNGLLVKDDIAKAILEDCTWVRFSLDTVDRKMYAKIRGVDALPLVLDNLEKLVMEKKATGSKCTIGTQTVVTRDNYTQLAQTASKLSYLEVDYYQIRPLENEFYSKALQDGIISHIEVAKRIETDQTKILVSGKWGIVNPHTNLKDRGYSECHCYPMIGAIDAHAKIHICCHFVGQKKYEYGHMVDDSIKDILTKREVVAKRIKMADCPMACRGNQINIRMEGLKRGCEHVAFL